MAADFTPIFTPYSGQGSFRFWAQKILPLVYDDSLSYYELLCKVVDILNNVIHDMKTVEDNTQALLDAYNELQGYVNTYFDNLDVQTEINTKLDAMAESGALSDLLEPFIPDIITGWLEDNITPTSPPIDSSLSVSGAAADAKVTGDYIAEINDTLDTVFQKMSDSEVSEITSLIGVPVLKWFRIGTSALESIIHDAEHPFPYTLNANYYMVYVDSYYGSYKKVDIVSSTGAEHYVGLTSAVHPGYFSWYDLSFNTVEADISSVNTSINNTISKLYNKLTNDEVTSLTNILNVDTPRWFNVGADKLAQILYDAEHPFPYTLGSNYYLVYTDIYTGNYKKVDIISSTGQEHYVGLTSAVTQNQYFNWHNSSYNTLANSINTLNTTIAKAPIVQTSSQVSGYTSILDAPIYSWFKADKATIASLTNNAESPFPYVLQSEYYIVYVDNYASSYKKVDIVSSNGVEHYVGLNSATHPNYCTWYNISYDSNIGLVSTEFSALNFDWDMNTYLLPNGNTQTSSNYATTKFFAIKTGDVIINPISQPDNTGHVYRIFINFYNSDLENIKRVDYSVFSIKNMYIIAPENASYAKICYGHNASEGVAISTDVLMSSFRIKISKSNKAQIDMRSDNYVAFGASTVMAAVHHTDNRPYTKSIYNYPDYVGKMLGINTVNLAVGSTGLVSRGSAGNLNNFMDQIYNNDAALSNAKLVTIQVAYGNDASVEYTDTESVQHTGLPVGTIYDLYPYDESGYHPSGLAGVNTMVNKGATWFGCLNWCIKYISEHYPLAQIVLIWGLFSQNTGISPINNRSIGITENLSEGIEAPKYTLVFNEPSESSKYSIINPLIKELVGLYGIDLINLFEDGLPMNYWGARTRNPDGTYVLFSTTGTAGNYVINNHPSELGYLMFSRYMAGKIIGKYNR